MSRYAKRTNLELNLVLHSLNKVRVVEMRQGSLLSLAEAISSPESLLIVLVLVLVVVLGLPHPEAMCNSLKIQNNCYHL